MRFFTSIIVAALALLPQAASAQSLKIDSARSRADFDIDLHTGSRVAGRFSAVEGEILQRADGQWQVQMTLASGETEVPGNARFTQLLRGAHFFDSQRHPEIRFVSEPFQPERLREGGVFHGELTLRGSTRRERLQLQATSCDAPFIHCPVEAHGQLARSRYGMRSLRWAAGDEVRFRLFLLAQASP